MRKALTIGLVLLAGLCLGQPQKSPNLFTTEKQDVTIVVRKSKLGPDDVTITVEDTYPRAQLQAQIDSLAQALGSEVLGLSFTAFNPNPQNPTGGYLRAVFSVRGLVERENGVFNLESVAKSFAGAKEPVDVLYLQFETEAPTTNVLQEWRDDNNHVLVQGRASPQFGIEYKIKLNTQDISKIRIPEGADAKEEQKAPPPEPVEPRASTAWIWSVVIIAALALGALVYSLLLRPRPSARPK